jgi:tetratricopeptide (TPR) repeat protein
MSFEAGTVVGRFVVLAPLGAGGMGIVQLAYDPKLDRRIALKFLHEQSADRTARLLREAQALGRLSHPNVVAIHDVGTHDEHVWLAMEYVEGETLAAWVGPGPAARSWRSVLELLRAAGSGVAAVHAAGLIHRDLKPSNLMIGKDGRVRVMDFGLVRTVMADDDTLAATPQSAASSSDLHATLTRSGELIGTPAYMAPEQFLGQSVDARTDQFSFCAVAWRALYGERPFAGESVAELRYAVIHGRRRPPPRGGDVPSWLRDTIARGLAVDPSDRWPSMPALLGALASGRRRARVRRSAATLGAIAVLGGGGYAYQQWDRLRAVAEQTTACEVEGRAIDEVWNDDTRARLEQAFMATESVLAGDSWSLARQHMDAFASEWTEARTRLCIETEIEGVRDPEQAESARDCLDERRTALAELADVFGRIDQAQMNASVPATVGLQSPSTCLDERSLASRSPTPPPELREPVAALQERMIRVDTLTQMRILDSADSEAAALLADAQKLGWPTSEAEARFRVGAVKLRLAEPDAAAENLEQALFLAAGHGHVSLAVDTASLLAYLAYERGNLTEGLRWGRIGHTLLARSELDLDLAEAHLRQSLGGVHLGRGALDESLVEFRRTIAIYERLLPADHPDLASALESACLVQTRRREYDDATALCQRSLEIYERSLPSTHPQRGNAINSFGLLHLERGAPEQAMPYFVESLAIAEATLPPQHPDFGLSYTNLGVVYLDSGDPAKALTEFQRAIDLWTKVLRPDHPFMAYPLEGKGRALIDLGKPVEAVAPLEQALALRSGEDFDPLEQAMTRYHLARALVADSLGRPRALELAREALATLRAKDATDKVVQVEAWLAEQAP